MATEYAAIRPTYPDSMYEFYISVAALRSQSQIIEIGCGTGQATLPLAKRGFEMLCLEPGTRLATIAREALAPFRNVRIEPSRFEDFDPAGKRFASLFSATAYHWIDPTVAVSKPYEILEPEGVVALVWNVARRDPSHIRMALDQAYARHAPAMAARSRDKPGALRKTTVARFENSKLYQAIGKEIFPWVREYSAAEYIRLIATYSDHLALPAQARADLFRQIKKAIVDVSGGSIELIYETMCYVFRKVGEA